MQLEFQKFPKIQRLNNIVMEITQKIHGTNAQIIIQDNGNIIAASKNRILSLEHDNYNFCAFVTDYAQELRNNLGPGRHYGEWAGPGINHGEGLTERKFLLFDTLQGVDKDETQLGHVPRLYYGKFDPTAIDKAMEDLKLNGSKLVPGFTKVEGIVVRLGNVRYKLVFQEEETEWRLVTKNPLKLQTTLLDVNHLLQPIRLKKLLSSDSQLLKAYPESLKTIVQLYVQDLTEENQFNPDKSTALSEKKSLGKVVYQFIKSCIDEMGINT